MTNSLPLKVEFSDRLPKAVFDLVGSCMSTDDVIRGSADRKARCDAEISELSAELPESRQLNRLRQRLEAAESEALRVAGSIERFEAQLTAKILEEDGESEADVARKNLERELSAKRIADHEVAVLRAAVVDAGRRHAEAVENLRSRRYAAYAESLKSDVEAAIETLRGILESPATKDALQQYATAFDALQRTRDSYAPPTRAPWNQSAPAPAVVG